MSAREPQLVQQLAACRGLHVLKLAACQDPRVRARTMGAAAANLPLCVVHDAPSAWLGGDSWPLVVDLPT